MQCFAQKWIYILIFTVIFTSHQTNAQQQRSPADPFVLFEKCGQIQEIPGDLRTRVPWTVSIYTRESPTSPFQYLLMGALIGPSTVISILGGAYGVLPKGAPGKYRLFKPENVVVVAGIKSANLSDTDEHTQFAQVEFLQPYNDKNPNNQDFHFFIVNLKTPFDVSTSYVRPICLVLYRPNASPYVKWDGFASSYSSSVAPSIKKQWELERKLTVYKGMAQKKDECDSAFRYYFGAKNASHVYCARVSGLVRNEDFNTCAAHGSPGFVFIVRRWFLNGLGATAPVRRRGMTTCDQSTIYFIAHFINQPVNDWARNQLECGPKHFTCNDGTGKCLELVKVCNGIKDCGNGDDEDFTFCKATNHCKRSTSHSCHLNGKCIKESQLCDHSPDCVGEWDEIHPKCFENKIDYRIIGLHSGLKCAPIQIHEGVKVTCFHRLTKQEINCEDSLSGDTAYLTCQNYFTSKFQITSLNITCDGSGIWTPKIVFVCAPECGVANSKVQQEEPNIFPWHVAIFHADENRKFKLICGGTLVEESIIVTSTKCLSEPTGLQANLRKFKIVLAPISDQFEENTNNSESQIFTINRVWTAPKPKINSRNFVSDIAIARLSRPVVYNEKIRAACYLQPHLKTFPHSGQSGQMPHLTDQGKSSKFWSTVTSHVVSGTLCNTRERILSDDSFCISNELPCTAKDSGSGLVFPILGKDKRYVLKGIVTDEEVYPNYQNQRRMCSGYLSITHVDSFSHWMFSILENSYRRDTLT